MTNQSNTSSQQSDRAWTFDRDVREAREQAVREAAREWCHCGTEFTNSTSDHCEECYCEHYEQRRCS